MSVPKVFDIELTDSNSEIVASIESHSRNNIEYTLDGVFDFMTQRKDYNPTYKVFKEYFVMCWSGQKKKIKTQTFYSRVDIELINEQVRLFYSTLDAVKLSYDNDSFKIIEYVNLGLNGKNTYYQLEETVITFGNNAIYSIDSKLLFKPPQYDKKILHHIFNANNALIDRLKQGMKLTAAQLKDLKNVPATYLICYFNGFDAALSQLQAAKPLLYKHSDEVYALYKESMRILRKAKYS